MQSRLLLLFLLLPPAAFADFEMQFSDGSVGMVSNGNVRFGDDVDYMLALAGEDGVIGVSEESRTWVRFDADYAEKMQAQMEAQMKEFLASVPPEQRAEFEQQMKAQQTVAERTARKTGNNLSVGGYDCSEVEMLDEHGDVDDVMCVATPDELGIADEDFRALAAAMQRIANIMRFDIEATPPPDLSELGGIPIMIGDSEDDGSELVHLDTGSIDAAEVAIPSDFREVTMEELMGQ